MKNETFILGIDTSNYTTSIALTDQQGEIIVDSRQILTVKQGERGLRQSHALFQHLEHLPELFAGLFSLADREQLAGIAVANRPRPVADSYMPVFKAGVQFGSVLSSCLQIPLFFFSHQEGHLAAAKWRSPLEQETEYLAFHLSGGTCELLSVNPSSIALLGGSKDISFGQVIDRIGVLLGMTFPAGPEMDRLALSVQSGLSEQAGGKKAQKHPAASLLKPIPLDGLWINLSGLETQCQRKAGEEVPPDQASLAYALFTAISRCLCQMTERAVLQTGCTKVLFCGGVSESAFIQQEVGRYFAGKAVTIAFGGKTRSSDNAVGISLLGGNTLWQSNR